jgi:hypothetical protein
LLGNALYGKITEFFGFGKDYWASRDESKYNDYIIYNTPTGQKPAAGTVGSIHGTVTNSVTQAPIADVEIYYAGAEEPSMMTDEDGEYMDDNVDVKINTFTATHDKFKDFTGTFTIIADDDITYDFMMDPIPLPNP